MSVKKCFVKVSFSVNGVHCWNDCPFEEVSFLRDPHHHKFIITVEAAVSHTDRDKEFIMLENELKAWMRKTYPQYNKAPLDYQILDFGRRSCETIADEINNNFPWFKEGFFSRRIEVSEDGYYSGIVEETFLV